MEKIFKGSWSHDKKDYHDYIAHKLIGFQKSINFIKNDGTSKELIQMIVDGPVSKNEYTEEQFIEKVKNYIKYHEELLDHYDRIYHRNDLSRSYELFNPIEFHKEMLSYKSDVTNYIYEFHESILKFLEENNEAQENKQTEN